MNLDEKIFRKETIEKYRHKIESLGPHNKLTTTNFLLSRLFMEILLILIFLLIPKYGLLLGIMVCIIFHFLYGYILIDNNINIRNNLLYDEALIFFRMLKLSLLSTNDLRKSLEIVASKNKTNSFALEFDHLLKKNNYNDLSLVFKDMQYKISNQDINIALLDLSKTNDYDHTLEAIIHNLQEKNNILIKQKYAKLPYILSVVSLAFIITFVLFVIYIEKVLEFIY